jgi:hypothetical protein
MSPEAQAFAATLHAAINAVFNVVLFGGIATAAALILPNLPKIISALKGA